MRELHNPSIAILASGSGSTAEAFIHATQDGRVDAEVGIVICNKPPEDAGVYARIARLNRQYGLDVQVEQISSKTHPTGKIDNGQTLDESAAICELVASTPVNHVALMGYMKLVRGELLEEYGWLPNYRSKYEARMSNTHPGPLPETQGQYGIHVSERVLELGLEASKHTVHLVSEVFDEGPIIAEHPFDVLPTDTPQTLFDRVQVVEKAALPYAIDKFLKEQAVYIDGNS